MLDIAVSYNRYKFLGNEFLTWLWFVIEKEGQLLETPDKDPVSLTIGNRITFENRLNDDAVESITIKGDDAGLEEGIIALRKGSVVTELNLSFKTGDQEWRFNIKGESLNLSTVKHPETAPEESAAKEEHEGVVLEKIYLYGKAVDFVDHMFKKFIRLRIAGEWNTDVLPRMRQWIAS